MRIVSITLIVFLSSLYVFAALPSGTKGKPLPPAPFVAVQTSPTPKEQVAIIRRVATQALGDIEQRLTTEEIAKLAPYREDPETAKELLVSILEDRIGALPRMYAAERDLLGPAGFKMAMEIKGGILKRGIRRINNWCNRSALVIQFA